MAQFIPLHIERVLDMSAEGLTQNLANKVTSNRSVASGRLKNSFIISELSPNGYTVEMVGYGQIVDEGRRRGTMPPTQPIVSWIREKSIRPKKGQTIEQLAFAIAMGIKKKGYRPKPFIQPAVDEMIQQTLQPLANATAMDIADYIDAFPQIDIKA